MADLFNSNLISSPSSSRESLDNAGREDGNSSALIDFLAESDGVDEFSNFLLLRVSNAKETLRRRGLDRHPHGLLGRVLQVQNGVAGVCCARSTVLGEVGEGNPKDELLRELLPRLTKCHEDLSGLSERLRILEGQLRDYEEQEPAESESLDESEPLIPRESSFVRRHACGIGLSLFFAALVALVIFLSVWFLLLKKND